MASWRSWGNRGTARSRRVRSRGLPGLVAADRLEARAGAHAPADQPSGNAPAPLRLGARGRDQRQILRRPDDRRPARGTRGRRRCLRLPPLLALGRAGPHPRQGDRARRLQRIGGAHGRGRQGGQPLAPRRRGGDSVRGGDRRRLRRPGRCRGRGRGDRGGARGAARRHQRDPLPGHGAHLGGPRPHRMARRDRGRDRGREAGGAPRSVDPGGRPARRGGIGPRRANRGGAGRAAGAGAGGSRRRDPDPRGRLIPAPQLLDRVGRGRGLPRPARSRAGPRGRLAARSSPAGWSRSPTTHRP